ncbi:hypothetical protein NQ315_016180 [Exocentrus adspersus]|uniref:Sulfotransferase domain-containing protein n=1 Tax=Exocentrus adspersus TaxID=1586481 RepID=A0AAV8VGX6_9CUCU|nr:hypothetical protein NQ315_016180 [Exocentrus adspersus]
MSPIPKYIEDVTAEKEGSNGDKKAFPYKITKVDAEVNKELLKYFTGERTGFVQVGPKKWFFPSGYERDAANYYNFRVRPDDTFVVTFPRSGTTWMQEMVWLLANDLNYEKAAKTQLEDRFPFLEFSSFVHMETKEEFLRENAYDEEKYQEVQLIDYPAWKILGEIPGRRFIKTHLPFSLLPQNLLQVGCKVIYIARNPRDVAVSFYHLNRSFRTQGYIGDFPRYWNYFEKNLQPWTPYWEHIKEGWSRRNEANLLFLFYEDINKVVNLIDSIKTVSNFLGRKYSDSEYETLAEHLDIHNFRRNKSVNFDNLKRLGILVSSEEGFVRKGKNGGWKDYFDEQLNARADRWIEENLKGTDLKFPSLS